MIIHITYTNRHRYKASTSCLICGYHPLPLPIALSLLFLSFPLRSLSRYIFSIRFYLFSIRYYPFFLSHQYIHHGRCRFSPQKIRRASYNFSVHSDLESLLSKEGRMFIWRLSNKDVSTCFKKQRQAYELLTAPRNYVHKSRNLEKIAET